jgi:hypothetical protein
MYEKLVKGVSCEVEKILIENMKSQQIHIEIGVEVGEVPTLSFEVKNRFPKIEG